MLVRTLSCLLFLSSISAFALPENDLGLARDAFKNLGKYAKDFEFTGQAGVKVHSLDFSFASQNPDGAVVVMIPGRSEAAGMYFELAYDLGQGGVSHVFAIDHRGQGLSGRMLPDSQKGYVDDFQFYVKDLSQWMDEVVLPNSVGKKIILVAHSMGGAIVTSYLSGLQSSPLKDRFSALVLTSPMFGIASSGTWMEKLAESYCKIGKTNCTDYAPFNGPYNPNEPFSSSVRWTTSENRYYLANDYFTAWPQAQVGGSTWGWVLKALKAARELRKHWELSTPTVLFQAGQEQIVDSDQEVAFCKAQAKCELVFLEGAKHSILIEKDEWRNTAIEKILSLTK